MRIATNDERRDGFFNVKGPFTGNADNHYESDWRISALWQPTQAFKALLKLDYNYIENGGIPAAPYTGSTANLFNTSSDSHLLGIERQARAVLQLNYVFDNGITVRSISGYQLGQDWSSRDVDGSDNPLIAEYYHARATDQTESEEVNILSPDRGRFRWVVGGVYQKDIVSQPDGTNWLSLAPGGTPTFSEILLADEYRASKASWGVFGQGTFDITPDLKLQAGLRYSESSFTLNSLSEAVLFGHPVLGQLVRNEREKDSRVTGKINLEWSLNADNFFYAFVATGHKGGGINGIGTLSAVFPLQPVTPAQAPPTFGPEEVTDYEIGWKASFFDNHLHTQIGGFYNDYRNFQVALYQVSTGLGQIENVPGHTQVDGIEAQGEAQFGALSFDFGASYLNTALGNFSAIEIGRAHV